jgi:2-succinyl-6-hydroxy-2,4-cyclohexadiene-1-carboxylate synthase
MVLLHGFTQTGESWSGVRAALPPRCSVLAPDLRGHGSAGAIRPVDLAAVLGDLEALVPERCVLVGYSMGGRLALHAALTPEIAGRLQRLVLIGASPGIADPGERSARRAADERLADQLSGMSIEAFAERWAGTPVLADQPAGVRAAAHEDRLRSTPSGLAAALRGLGTGALPSLWERLGELSMPVSLVVGERDVKFAAIAAEMAAAISHAEVLGVAGAGHTVHLERPGELARILAG